MREIKFRAWIKNECKMCPVEKLLFPLQVFPIRSVEVDNGRGFGIDEVELMQYTGLKDKNGKEIYEGDLCKDEELLIAVVWMDDYHCWGYKVIDGSYVYNGITFPIFQYGSKGEIQRTIEVTGNIYENPELFQNIEQQAPNWKDDMLNKFTKKSNY